MSESNEQLLIVQKYETFINYLYPISQNIPREHGVAKEKFISAMLNQVNLFQNAGKSNQISKLYEADSGLSNLRFWLRFMSHKDRKIITIKQHRTAEIMLAEVGKLLGSWISNKQKSK